MFGEILEMIEEYKEKMKKLDMNIKPVPLRIKWPLPSMTIEINEFVNIVERVSFPSQLLQVVPVMVNQVHISENGTIMIHLTKTENNVPISFTIDTSTRDPIHWVNCLCVLSQIKDKLIQRIRNKLEAMVMNHNKAIDLINSALQNFSVEITIESLKDDNT
ncbi:hypothetical protein J7L13_01240 [bacterium]|nr:hypothetical protein [bacterium]